jgi:outer membrane protein assembly factor BamA
MALACPPAARAQDAARPRAPAPLPADQAARGQQAPEVRALRFPGARALAEAQLRMVVQTQETRCRSPLFAVACLFGVGAALERAYLPDDTTLSRDAARLERLYEAWGYPEARVSYQVVARGGGAVAVEFAILEGGPVLVESVEVRGLEGFTPPVAVPDPLPLRAGAPYALPRLAAAEDVLLRALGDRGYPFASLELGGDVDEAARRARVVLRVVPGPLAFFGETEILTEPPVPERVVRRALDWAPGDTFRISALERAERRLRTLPIVENAAAAAQAVAGQDVVGTRVAVQSARRAGFQTGGTLSSAQCLELGGSWRDRWFAGGPRVFTASVAFSNLLAREAGGAFPCTATGGGIYAEPNYRASIDLWQPWVGSPRNALLVRAFASRESSPHAYVMQGLGGEVGVVRELGRDASLQVGYVPRRSELRAVGLFFCANYGACEPEAMEPLAAPRWSAPAHALLLAASPGAGIVARPMPGFDWLPGQLPAWRHRLRLGAEIAGRATASDYAFQRGILDAATTRILLRDLELAGRVRFGGVTGDNVLPPQLRFYSGGVNSVRATEQNLAGPLVMFLSAGHDLHAAPAPACPGPDCDLGTVAPRDVTVRPTGGESVIEASIEARVWVADRLQLAAFVDHGTVARRMVLASAGQRTASITAPGAGIRWVSPLGPIRIDAGYDPRPPARHPVYAELPDGGVQLLGTALLDPHGHDGATAVRRFWRRLQLHFAVGQPF